MNAPERSKEKTSQEILRGFRKVPRSNYLVSVVVLVLSSASVLLPDFLVSTL
jgi:hypothetical protein